MWGELVERVWLSVCHGSCGGYWIYNLVGIGYIIWGIYVVLSKGCFREMYSC